MKPPRPFDFGHPRDFGPLYSKPVPWGPNADPFRVSARALGKGALTVELQVSSDRENWSVLRSWQASGPGSAIFGEVRTQASWLRAKVSSVSSPLAFAVALLE